MSVVQSRALRSRIEETPSGLIVVIPVRRYRAQLLTAMLGLAMFLAVVVFFAPDYRDIFRGLVPEAGGRWRDLVRSFGPHGLGLLGAAAGGVFALAAWIQMLAGYECWQVDSEGLTRSWGPLPLPRARRYLTRHMRNLRPVAAEPDWWHEILDPRWWTGMSPTIAFDYGARTIHLGSQVDQAEGRQIVEAILRRFPALGQGEEGRASGQEGES